MSKMFSCNTCGEYYEGDKCLNRECPVGRINNLDQPTEMKFASLHTNSINEEPIKLQTDKVLEEMANTFREKNTTYGDNYLMVGEVLAKLFPNGVVLKSPEDFIRWHFMDWMVGKMTRFVKSNMSHIDSIHDQAVYTAMLRDYIEQTQRKQK